jgi:hypothetical protein
MATPAYANAIPIGYRPVHHDFEDLPEPVIEIPLLTWEVSLTSGRLGRGDWSYIIGVAADAPTTATFGTIDGRVVRPVRTVDLVNRIQNGSQWFLTSPEPIRVRVASMSASSRQLLHLAQLYGGDVKFKLVPHIPWVARLDEIAKSTLVPPIGA